MTTPAIRRKTPPIKTRDAAVFGPFRSISKNRLSRFSLTPIGIACPIAIKLRLSQFAEIKSLCANSFLNLHRNDTKSLMPRITAKLAWPGGLHSRTGYHSYRVHIRSRRTQFGGCRMHANHGRKGRAFHQPDNGSESLIPKAFAKFDVWRDIPGDAGSGCRPRPLLFSIYQ